MSNCRPCFPNVTVSVSPGEILSKDYDCNFFEVAAADQVTEVAFHFPTLLGAELIYNHRETLEMPLA